jgi:hypothetical protein
MGESVRRGAATEAVFRQVNEEIESLERGRSQVSDNQMHILCECTDAGCTETLIVPMPEYEKIRSDPTLFFVTQGHEKLFLENVVEQVASYWVVRKRPGEAETIVRETDPRSS